MCDRGAKFPKTALTIGDLGAEQILMMTVERFALKIFVGTVAQGHGGARQYVLDASAKARLFILGGVQGGFDGAHYRSDAGSVGFRVPLGRAGLEILIAKPRVEIIVCARSQEQLKHYLYPVQVYGWAQYTQNRPFLVKKRLTSPARTWVSVPGSGLH
jgi:hypothetical protein